MPHFTLSIPPKPPTLRSIAAWSFGLLVPAACVVCGAGGTAVCSDCSDALLIAPRTSGAVIADDGLAARLVRIAKSGRSREAAREVVRITRLRIASGRVVLPAVRWVTWIPPDPHRARSRGYHLPQLLAEGIACEAGVPPLEMLTRAHAPPQRGSDVEARQRNVEHVFSTKSGAIVGEPVLLVDDVRTTGSTLRAASRPLRELGMTVHTIAFSVVAKKIDTC